MKALLNTATSQNIRYLAISSLLIIGSACHANELPREVDKSSKKTIDGLKITSRCPLISSQNWSASIAPADNNESTLYISGDVELPNPGYSVTIEDGIIDKNEEVRQEFNIKIERLDGFHIQAISPMTLKHSTKAIADKYHAIVINCAGTAIAKIQAES